jgi:hypothetical protein
VKTKKVLSGTNSLLLVMAVTGCNEVTMDPAAGVKPQYSEKVVLDLGPPGSFDSCHAKYPSILEVGSELWMYYNGRTDDCKTGAIGLAVSTDKGETWKKRGKVLSYKVKADHPSVLIEEGVFRMWLTLADSKGYQIGYSDSPDGLNWSTPRVLLSRINTPYENRAVLHPSVTRDLNTGLYHMFYDGQGRGDSTLRLMHATSPDGLEWTRTSPEPVFGKSYSYNAAVDFSDGYVMFVSTLNEQRSCVYRAKSEDSYAWKLDSQPVICNSNDKSQMDSKVAFSLAIWGTKLFYSAGDSTKKYRVMRNDFLDESLL